VDTWILGITILGKEFTVAKTQPAYPSAFRAEAVELARTSGKGVPQLARDLGISEQALRGWIKRAAIDAGRGQPGALTTDEREELRRLRREVKVLQQEREILRKAAAFFARETL
jgi:transposase-like protein